MPGGAHELENEGRIETEAPSLPISNNGWDNLAEIS
jgi:hypothetical protein